MPKKFRPWIAISFLVLFSIAGIRAVKIKATDASARSYMHGDGPSDLDAMSSIQYFYDHGFIKSWFRPMLNYQPGVTSGEAYTHSPALPNVLWGFGARLVNNPSETASRILPILFSVLWFFLIFQFFSSIIPNPKAAVLSSLILVSSSYFALWTDSLHKGALEEIFRLLYVWGLISYYRTRAVQKEKANYILFGLFFVGALISNTSLETVPFCAVFTIALAIIYQGSWKKVFTLPTFILGGGFVFGFALHMHLNALYYGGWDAAIRDMITAGAKRSGQCGDASYCGLAIKEVLLAPISFVNRIERHFLIPGWALIFFAAWALKSFKVNQPELYKVGIALLIASPAWFFLMPQHALVHHFVARNWGLFYGFVIGTGLLIYKDMVISHWKQKRKRILALHFVFTLYCVLMMITQQLIPTYWSFSFAYLF